MTAGRSSAAMGPLMGVGELSGARIVGAEGMELIFEDGVRAIDLAAQDSSVIFGHRHPELVAAVRDAADQVFVSDTSAGYPMRDAATEAIRTVAFGGEFAGAVRFTLTGSEAIDLGLALSQALTRRSVLVSRENAYHGAIGLGRDTTTHVLINGGLARPGGGWQPRGPSGVPTRVLPLEDELTDEALASALDGAAAVITDYGSGHLYPSLDYFNRIAAAAREAGALWLHDETVSAYGRCGTGRWFHFHDLAHKPDMVALSKCITGGAAPGAALVLSERVVELLDGRRWTPGSTFWGHPLQIAAVLKTLELMERERVVDRVPRSAELLGKRLDLVAERHPDVFAAHRGSGLIRSLVLSGGDPNWRGDGTQEPPAVRFMELARKEGVSVPAYGGSQLWVVPPLLLDEETIERIGTGLERAAERL